MVVWSAFRPLLTNPAFKTAINGVVRRNMSGGHNTFPLQPSRWQWNKFKDMLHFYVLLGVIPCSLVILASNLFIGPAQLSEIPEGYEPKYWEYYRHPITRFIARYCLRNPQQDYEKQLHMLYEEDEKAQLREIEKRVKFLMSQRQDYQVYYYRPISAKYHRMAKESSDYLKEIRGD